MITKKMIVDCAESAFDAHGECYTELCAYLKERGEIKLETPSRFAWLKSEGVHDALRADYVTRLRLFSDDLIEVLFEGTQDTELDWHTFNWDDDFAGWNLQNIVYAL